MTDQVPDPSTGAFPPPPPVVVPTAAVAGPAGRQVPPRLGGAYYSTGLVILLTIVTFGIWGVFWTWRTSGDLQRYNGDGFGSALSLLLYIVISPLLMFTIPNEIDRMYQRDGQQSPVSAVWGLWFLLPIVGHIIWYVKVQNALNDFWLQKGAQAG